MRYLFVPFMFIAINIYAPTLDQEEQRNARMEEEMRRIEREKRIDLLLEAIRIVESGGVYDTKGASGEYGAYQFTKPTWRMYSYLYFREILDMTPENQDKVARRKVEKLVDNGFSDKEIASFWNSGRRDWRGRVGVNQWGVRYDVPNHVRKVDSVLTKIRGDET